MPKFYQAANLSRFKDLRHGFSSKIYGNLSWQTAKTKEKWEETAQAQNNFAKDLGIKAEDIISAYQTHSRKVLMVGPHNKRITAFPADGLLTCQPGVALMIHTADCLPVLFFDPVKKVIAAVHAGWRGVLNKISVEAVLTMEKNFDSRSSDILAALGPALGPCHFEVKEDVWQPFKETFKSKLIFSEEKGRLFLNMWEAVREQLIAAGVPDKNIEVSKLCTFCNEKDLSSFRRDKNLNIAMGSIISREVARPGRAAEKVDKNG